MSEVKERLKKSLSILGSYTKVDNNDALEYRGYDEAFYEASPVSREDVKKLDEYSKNYTERALKATTVFAVDAFKKDKDVDTIIYDIPYREDRVKLVYTRDNKDYSSHVEYDVKHMNHRETLKGRIKALNKAMAED